MKRSAIVASLVLAFWGFVAPCQAEPLRLVMTVDELRNGVAVLFGDLNGAFVGTDSIILVASEAMSPGDANETPEHWTAGVIISRRMVDGATTYDIDLVNGKHISDPPPHPELGEASPGPSLVLGGGPPTVFDNLHGLGNDPPDPLVRMISVIHDAPEHADLMTVTLIDLQPGADNPTVLVAGPDEIRMTIVLHHLPEPSSLVLAGLGTLGLAGYRWRLRKGSPVAAVG